MKKKSFIIGTAKNSNKILVLQGNPAVSTYTYEQRNIDLRNEKQFLNRNIEQSDGIDEIRWVRISAENFYKIAADAENLYFLKPNEPNE